MANHSGFEHINFYQSEENLRQASDGPDFTCARKLPQEDNPGVKYQVDIDDEGDEDKQIQVTNQLKQMENSPELDFANNTSPYFSSVIKAYIIKYNENVERRNMNIPPPPPFR